MDFVSYLYFAGVWGCICLAAYLLCTILECVSWWLFGEKW